MKQSGNKIIRRVFVALPVSPELRAEILKWEQKFSHWPVRWLKGKNLHVTLVPPWAETDLSGVVERLKIAHKTEPFSLLFKRVTLGPNLREPRLIWAEGQTPAALSSLKQNIEKALEKVPERRPFSLHLTLARFQPKQFSFLPIKTLSETVNWPEAITSFALMESRLSPAGAEYQVLKKFMIK